jgi:hypothetical protein
MRSALALTAMVLLSLLLSGCESASEDDPLSTSTTIRGTAQGEVSLRAAPDADSTELELLVTSFWCSGGTIPAGIHSVDVEESDDAVVLDVRIELPVGTWPTTCPPNPILPVAAPLDSPLGDRTVTAISEQGRVLLWPDVDLGE